MIAMILGMVMLGQGFGDPARPPVLWENEPSRYYYAQEPVVQQGYGGTEGGWILDLSSRPYRGGGWQRPWYEPYRHYDLAPAYRGGYRMRLW